MNKKDALLEKCEGIEIKKVTKQYNNGQPGSYTRVTYYQVGDIVVPDNVYIKIDATTTKGTIGKLVGIDVEKIGTSNEVSPHNITYILQVAGHKGTNRIGYWHAAILENHDGTTKFVRNIKKHPKGVIPPHVNKYNQTLYEGKWVAGLGPGKVLYFGQVTRWSKSSVWVNPTPSLAKSKENCISYVKETLVLPAGIDYEQMVTIMALSGWKR